MLKLQIKVIFQKVNIQEMEMDMEEIINLLKLKDEIEIQSNSIILVVIQPIQVHEQVQEIVDQCLQHICLQLIVQLGKDLIMMSALSVPDQAKY